jgi:MarR family transcriptional regulator, temperature-dependent positive regulator of motility
MGLETSAVHLLHRAGQRAGDIFSDEMSKVKLTPRQYAVLVSVAEHEGLSQTGLVERTGIDRSTLADIIRRMLRKGLLQRKRTKEDARAYSVRLTEEGRSLLEAAAPGAFRSEDRLLAALPHDQRDAFLSALATIVKSMEMSDGAASARSEKLDP